MPSQSVSGTITPAGEITEILIEGDNPGGTITPFGAMNWEANFSVSSPDLGGLITPTGDLSTSDDVTCFPAVYECFVEPVPDVSCLDTCEPNEIPTPPNIDLSGVIIPVGTIVEPCEEEPMTCCLLCGDVTPEGNEVGDIGCLYEFTAADVTSPQLDHPIWAKLSGSGNTGWGPMYGLPGDGVDSVRVGPGADAAADDTTAVGGFATANQEDASAFGSEATATGLYSTALGHGASATEEGATAVGGNSFAIAEHATAVGWQAQADGVGGALAIGWGPISTGEHGISIGYHALNDVDSRSSIAIGYIAEVKVSENAIAIGCLAKVGTIETFGALSGIAIGPATECQMQYGIAIGTSALIENSGNPSDESNGIAIGRGANLTAAAVNSTAIGGGAECDNPGCIAIGDGALAEHDVSFVFGAGRSSAAGQLLFGGQVDRITEVRFNHNVSFSAAPNVVMCNAALATNATEGFPYIPTMAGTPSGTPHAYTGAAPIIVDTTAGKIWAYYGGAWHFATLT